MNKLLVLFAVVAVAAAMPVDSDSSLMKRIMGILEEKRNLSWLKYDGRTKEIRITFGQCAPGSLCDQRSGNILDLYDIHGNKMMEMSEVYIGGNGSGVHKYSLANLRDGDSYRVEACVMSSTGNKSNCNSAFITAGRSAEYGQQ